MASWKWFAPHIAYQWGPAPVNWVSDDLKVMLTTSGYTPDQDRNDVRGTVSSEVAGVGYQPGGVPVTGKAVTYNRGSKETRFSFDSPEWGPSASIQRARVAVLYKDAGGASRDPLIAFAVLDEDVSVSNGTFALDVDAASALKIIAA